jgi:polyhydroxyalkanoate synthase
MPEKKRTSPRKTHLEKHQPRARRATKRASESHPTPIPAALEKPPEPAHRKDSPEMLEEMFNVPIGLVEAIGNAQEANVLAATRTMELMSSAWGRLWGLPGSDVLAADRRFADDAWTSNPALDTLKQSYLITSRWLLDLADGLGEIDPILRQRAVFYTRQLTNASSPANLPWINPTVVAETIRTGGTNLWLGMQNLLSDLFEGRIEQVPKNSFTVGKDLAITPGHVVFRNKLVELIQYEPSTPQVFTKPILIIPPWVNKYYVLDLRPQNSMVKYLADSGFTVFMISWKNPDSSLRDLSWEDYMTLGPLDAIRVVKSITGSDQINLVGYCLGGLLLETVVAYLAAHNDPTPNTTTYFAVHQDFDNAGDLACFISHPEVAFLEWLMDQSGGYLDGRNMGATFNLLRPNDLIWNYVVNNYLMGKQPPVFDILYWNNDSTRVPERIHSFYLHKFFLEHKLNEPGGLKLLGAEIDLKKLTTPTFVVVGAEDHIVPWKSAFKMRDLVSGPLQFTLAESGHIAGIVNPPGAKARGYWCEDCTSSDPDEWLHSCARKQTGSWWTNWKGWLEKQSGDKVAPPSVGNADYPPLVKAPGTYVLED